VANGPVLELAAGGGSNRVIRTPSLTIPTAFPLGPRLDLQDNKLIVAGIGQTGSWNASANTYTGVTGLIEIGRNAGQWNFSGIITTQSQAHGNTALTTLGVATASDVRPTTATATALWAGQTITGTDTLVMYTYGGDATLDGKINIDDYIKIDNGIATHLTGWSNGDFNYDGKVNIDDYTQYIDANIGIQGAPFPTSSGISQGVSDVSAVPEPEMIAGVVLLGMALPRRRRRSYPSPGNSGAAILRGILISSPSGGGLREGGLQQT
jgi:hypothetical protein